MEWISVKDRLPETGIYIAIRGMATAIYTELFGLCNKCSTDIAPKSPVDCMQDALRDMCTCAAVRQETLKNIIRGLGI